MKKGWCSWSKEPWKLNPMPFNTECLAGSHLACSAAPAPWLCPGWGAPGGGDARLPGEPSPQVLQRGIAQSSLHSLPSTTIKLPLLFRFKSSSELSELKINRSGLENAEPPGSRKHLFLFSARCGKSAFSITYRNFDCHFASPHPTNSHFNFQK